MTQTLVVLLLVSLAALYVGVRIYRAAQTAKQAKDGCGGSCGCDSTTASASVRSAHR